MRVHLWVDDTRPAPANTSKESYISVTDYDSAINELQQKQFDVIHLDHDLGDSKGRTGLDILKWMCANQIWPLIRIHTMNPIGMRDMLAYIVDVEKGLIPMGTPDEPRV